MFKSKFEAREIETSMIEATRPLRAERPAAFVQRKVVHADGLSRVAKLLATKKEGAKALLLKA